MTRMINGKEKRILDLFKFKPMIITCESDYRKYQKIQEERLKYLKEDLKNRNNSKKVA